MATTCNGINSARASKTVSSKINEIAFTMEDVEALLKERQDIIDFQHQQEKLEKKKQILAKADEVGNKKNVKITAASIADILGFDPKKKISASDSGKSINDVPAKFRKYYEILLELKSKCKSGVCKLANANLNISTTEEKKEHKTVSSHPDVDSFDTHFALGLLSSEQEALSEIDAAIKRIFDGTYGVCEVTGQPIEPARLAAVPFTRYSVEGKIQQEKIVKTKDRVGDGSIFAAEMDDNTSVDYGEEYDE